MQTASQTAVPLGLFAGQSKPRLYDRAIEVLRVHHHSLRTERAYLGWIRRFILFHRPHHPRDLSEADTNRFLTHLAVDGHVSASTQNQALAAILFLYEKVLEQPLDRIEGVVRAKRPKRLPVVLTREDDGNGGYLYSHKCDRVEMLIGRSAMSGEASTRCRRHAPASRQANSEVRVRQNG